MVFPFVKYRSGEYARTAYVTFKDAYAVETAMLLSGATIVDQCVCIGPWRTSINESDPWNCHACLDNESSSTGTQMSQFVSMPGEAVTVAQEVVKTMITKGYVLGTDALMKAKAFDESHLEQWPKWPSLATKLDSPIKFMQEWELLKPWTRSSTYPKPPYQLHRTRRTAVAVANAVVNSSYFAKGALLVSDTLTHAASQGGS